MYVITNMTKEDLKIDGVSINPKQQLSVATLSEDMLRAKEAGTLRVMSGDTTQAERRADIEAIHASVPR